MDITGIAKSHQAGIQKTGKPSSKKEWRLSDSLREKITEYAKEDAAQNVYMGKSLWHCATIGHILKNRLYCGEMGYQKEYVPDYLEQKRAKNNGELDRIIVEGKHQPIVTKEEFEKVQNLLAERNAESRNYRKNKGTHSDDFWRRKSSTPSLMIQRGR